MPSTAANRPASAAAWVIAQSRAARCVASPAAVGSAARGGIAAAPVARSSGVAGAAARASAALGACGGRDVAGFPQPPGAPVVPGLCDASDTPGVSGTSSVPVAPGATDSAGAPNTSGVPNTSDALGAPDTPSASGPNRSCIDPAHVTSMCSPSTVSPSRRPSVQPPGTPWVRPRFPCVNVNGRPSAPR
ncbi:hypothetical protein GCM10018785_68650 [Streptomyces longispororuber]|uniref:Uncharacterized protein n=1 Tax=Streptomyces longispororuber TaxID=68230 RepID=A0A919DY73_9ACTN|nr:hypothetical protein GCM10018785_68650 [Streptomyces longispororuber]